VHCVRIGRCAPVRARLRTWRASFPDPTWATISRKGLVFRRSQRHHMGEHKLRMVGEQRELHERSCLMLYHLHEPAAQVPEPGVGLGPAFIVLVFFALQPARLHAVFHASCGWLRTCCTGSARNTSPEFGLDTSRIDRARHCPSPKRPWLKSRSAAASFQAALANGVSRHRSDPACADRGAVVGPSRDTAARHGAHTAAEHEVYITDWIDAPG